MKKLLLVIVICYATINSNAQTSNPVIGTYTYDVESYNLPNGLRFTLKH